MFCFVVIILLKVDIYATKILHKSRIIFYLK
nr:MAG TPA: hypothetical protein [Bacteriophage sp.]